MFDSKIINFDFRLVDLPDGSQLINDKVKTPVDALTPEMQLEYMEIYNSLTVMEMLRRKARREAEQQQKMSRNLLYKLVRLFGLV